MCLIPIYTSVQLQVLLSVTIQIGLAVGDTQEQQKKAEFTKFKVWVSIRDETFMIYKCTYINVSSMARWSLFWDERGAVEF